MKNCYRQDVCYCESLFFPRRYRLLSLFVTRMALSSVRSLMKPLPDAAASEQVANSLSRIEAIILRRSHNYNQQRDGWEADDFVAHQESSQRHRLLSWTLRSPFVVIMLFSRTRNGSLRKGKDAFLTGLCGLLSISILPSMAIADKTAADYFVQSLPGAPDGPLLKMHAG